MDKFDKIILESLKPMDLNKLQKDIENLEEKIGLKSEEVRMKIRSGKIKETEDICDLLMLLNIRDQVNLKRLKW